MSTGAICNTCYHCDNSRVNDDGQVRCRKLHKWVNPISYAGDCQCGEYIGRSEAEEFSEFMKMWSEKNNIAGPDQVVSFSTPTTKLEVIHKNKNSSKNRRKMSKKSRQRNR
jgi:hypothetical protein